MMNTYYNTPHNYDEYFLLNRIPFCKTHWDLELLYYLFCLNTSVQCAGRKIWGLTGRRKSAAQCQCNIFDKKVLLTWKSKEIFYQFYNHADKVTHQGARHYHSICIEKITAHSDWLGLLAFGLRERGPPLVWNENSELNWDMK